MGATRIFNTWGDAIAAIAEIATARHRRDASLLQTDATWQSGLSPILKSGIYFGEIYDARSKSARGPDGSAVLAFDTSALVPHETTPVRELRHSPLVRTLEGCREAARSTISARTPAAMSPSRSRAKPAPGSSSSMPRFSTSTASSTTRNFRSAERASNTSSKGGGAETYRPIFTFQGFRYARVTIEGTRRDHVDRLRPDQLGAAADRRRSPRAHALVNRLVENTIWSQRSNFIDVPTDCPQRDERLGWTGDAQVFAATACYLHDSQTFLANGCAT